MYLTLAIYHDAPRVSMQSATSEIIARYAICIVQEVYKLGDFHYLGDVGRIKRMVLRCCIMYKFDIL